MADAKDFNSSSLSVTDLPNVVLETIFIYLNLSDIQNLCSVCKRWNRFFNDGNNYVWRYHCFRLLSEEALNSLSILSGLSTYKGKLLSYLHAWNPEDKSRNILIKSNGFTSHRNPVAQSTDGIKGKIGFKNGRHAWEVIWEGPLGTVAVIGIATREAPTQCKGYVPLLGSNNQSWGWNLVDNYLLHDGDTQGHYPTYNNVSKYQVGEKIRVILDLENKTLAFERNYEFLGVAFKDLPNNKRLYPAISAVYGNTDVSMIYIGSPLDG